MNIHSFVLPIIAPLELHHILALLVTVSVIDTDSVELKLLLHIKLHIVREYCLLLSASFFSSCPRVRSLSTDLVVRIVARCRTDVLLSSRSICLQTRRGRAAAVHVLSISKTI